MTKYFRNIDPNKENDWKYCQTYFYLISYLCTLAWIDQLTFAWKNRRCQGTLIKLCSYISIS